MSTPPIAVNQMQLAAFCQRWKISELALFGSVLRDDFGPDSDVDMLVSFQENARWGLLDHVQMEQELEALVKRNVDLVSKRAVQRSANWLRRREILDTVEVVFATGVDHGAR